MSKQNNQLKNRIMRRVYYAYASRIASNIITIELALFCLALYAFAKMVHVKSVIDNMLATNLGSLPQFVAGAVLQGEALTLIAIGVMTFTILSVPLQVRSYFLPKTRMA